jgi:hypothetical protein
MGVVRDDNIQRKAMKQQKAAEKVLSTHRTEEDHD